jgi:hypothetical protein
MQILIDRQWKKGLVIFIGLVLFHVAVSVLLSVIARSSFLSSLHNGQGFWNFALDSFGYHKEAMRLLDYLKHGDYGSWWASTPWWHVKWIALSYAVITPDPLSFAPINALTWAVSVVCVYKIVRQLFPDHRVLAVLSTTMFGLWPSYLFQSTQLLKDPLYSMGILTMVCGWVALLSGRRGILFCFLVSFGVLLAYLNRIYILEPLIFLSLLATALILWRVPRSRIYALLAFAMIGGLYVYQYCAKVKPLHQIEIGASISANPAETKMPRSGTLTRYSNRVTSWLRYQVMRLANARDLWIEKYPNAGINIDTDVHFRSLKDILAYIPKAAIIGFLAPFPSHWIGVARTAGRASRILAGLEMMVWYILLPGFVYFLFSGTVAPHIRIWMLVYTLSLVLLTALVVTNIGALYRMRFVYFLPILIGGLEGWARFYGQRFQKTAS